MYCRLDVFEINFKLSYYFHTHTVRRVFLIRVFMTLLHSFYYKVFYDQSKIMIALSLWHYIG